MNDEITINGTQYVKKSTDGLKYCIVRTYSAGVYAGFVKERNGKEAILSQARIIHSWKGAKTTIEIANNGIDMENSNVSEKGINDAEVTEVIFCIECTEKAKKLFNGDE